MAMHLQPTQAQLEFSHVAAANQIVSPFGELPITSHYCWLRQADTQRSNYAMNVGHNTAGRVLSGTALHSSDFSHASVITPLPPTHTHTSRWSMCHVAHMSLYLSLCLQRDRISSLAYYLAVTLTATLWLWHIWQWTASCYTKNAFISRFILPHSVTGQRSYMTNRGSIIRLIYYYHYHHCCCCFHLMSIFLGEPQSCISWSYSPALSVPEENLWKRLFISRMSLLPLN